jgi:hypothetical protein
VRFRFAALLNDGTYAGVRILEERSVREMLRFATTRRRWPVKERRVHLATRNAIQLGELHAQR